MGTGRFGGAGVDPPPETATGALDWVDHRDQLEVAVPEGDYAIGRSVLGMASPGLRHEPISPGQVLAAPIEVWNAKHDVIDNQGHYRILARNRRRLSVVKRYSPLLVAAALAALALAALKLTEEKAPERTWTPVRPS